MDAGEGECCGGCEAFMILEFLVGGNLLKGKGDRTYLEVEGSGLRRAALRRNSPRERSGGGERFRESGLTITKRPGRGNKVNGQD